MPALIEGYCNGCGEFGELHRDHVPPKGSANLSRVEIRTLADHMGTSRARPRFGETGIRFRTLCQGCNSTRLGKWYDPELKRISSGVTRVLQASALLALPSSIAVGARPQRVARAVVGHLLAALPPELAGQAIQDGAMPKALRAYFLDPDAPLPDRVSIYYWTYPHRRVVIARAITKIDINFRPLIMGDVLKFYPLGYWIVWDTPPLKPGASLAPLLADRSTPLDAECELVIRFDRQPPLDFPEAPEANQATLMHDRAGITAGPRLTLRQVRTE